MSALAGERLMTAGEVADWLQVSPAWVRDHCTRKEPILPHAKIGDLLRFQRADIEAWLKKNMKGAAK